MEPVSQSHRYTQVVSLTLNRPLDFDRSISCQLPNSDALVVSSPPAASARITPCQSPLDGTDTFVHLITVTVTILPSTSSQGPATKNSLDHPDFPLQASRQASPVFVGSSLTHCRASKIPANATRCKISLEAPGVGACLVRRLGSTSKMCKASWLSASPTRGSDRRRRRGPGTVPAGCEESLDSGCRGGCLPFL